jgi:hypothetical protein
MTREVESFRQFIFDSIDRLVGCLDGLTSDQLNWRPPAPETNSLYVLASHIVGNAEQNLLGVLCGQPVARNRAAEFAAAGETAEPVRRRWQELRAQMEAALDVLPPSRLDQELKHPRGMLTGREVLTLQARHAAEHLGQAELTRQLLLAELARRS